MKKIGSIEFFENIDLDLKFNFDDLTEHFEADETGIEKVLLDDNKNLKMDKLDEFVQAYINNKIKTKFGEEYFLDSADEQMNISWNVKINSIKKKNIKSWWNKEN
jgi:hypothetical protein